jgi:arylsulfatase
VATSIQPLASTSIEVGQRSDAFAYAWDIMPTILEIAGAEYPAEYRGREIEPVRGRSMLGLLDGTKEAIYGSDEFIGGEMLNGKWMRQGDLKAVFIPEPDGPGAWQLFKVVDDPGEAKDLSKELPDQLETLKAAWEQYAADVGVIAAD